MEKARRYAIISVVLVLVGLIMAGVWFPVAGLLSAAVAFFANAILTAIEEAI